jgi:hypothetical protein
MDFEKLLLSGLPLLFAILWLGILHFCAWMGGWTQLAREFADDGSRNKSESKNPSPPAISSSGWGGGFPKDTHKPIRRRWFQSGSFGWMNYGSCLNIAVYDDGVRIAVLWPFRPGHAPLFIPWGELKEPRVRRVFPFVRRLEVKVGTPPVKVLLPVWVGEGMRGQESRDGGQG